jgi:hypothetical protein
MRQSLKISLSFLISTIVFSVFAVVSFTGFFSVIETSFFQPRITSRVEQQLTAYIKEISAYHSLNAQRFSGLMNKKFVWTAFARDQSGYEQEIKDRENEFGRLLDTYPSLQENTLQYSGAGHNQPNTAFKVSFPRGRGFPRRR